MFTGSTGNPSSPGCVMLMLPDFVRENSLSA